LNSIPAEAVPEREQEVIPNEEDQETFRTGEVITIAGGHLVNDTYTAFLPALLPVIIDKLSLSLTLAGSLTAIQSIPGLLNPFIGYLADKMSLRYFVIFAPAATATLVSLMGLAPNYFVLAFILLLTGVSIAAFHAPAPAMIGRISGKQIGRGMSYFMATGELARTIGPLIAVWAVSLWSLDGIYRLMWVGWMTSLILFLRLRAVPARTTRGASLRSALPKMRRLFAPMIGYTLARNFMIECLVTYLAVYMNSRGASLWIAGASLSLLEIAGVAGALISGTISDHLGRKPVLLGGTLISAAVMFFFINSSGWILVPILLVLGFSALSTTPVLMAMVQEHLPENRAIGNGIYMLIGFALRPISILAVGFMGDRLGLQAAFTWSAIISLLAIPAIFALPNFQKQSEPVQIR
jgi:FSR family fosmidomycin resistance protein-like MFS transporter